MDSTSTKPPSAIEAARQYLARGWAPLPIVPKSKKPDVPEDWPNFRVSADELPKHFGRSNGVGILLGEPSNWLVDVDLDLMPEAVELAADFLPPTSSIFGRAGKPRSHWLYYATAPVETLKREVPKGDHPLSGKMIVELRSTKLQTVFPPSLHVSGERIEWVNDGEPSRVAPDALVAAVNALADDVLKRLGIDITPKPTQRSIGRNGHPADIDRDKIVERCRKYIAKMPEAISEKGGHNQTFHVACECFRFALTDDEAAQVVGEYNARCEPPWTEKELVHKLETARNTVTKDGQFGSRLREHRPAPARFDEREFDARLDDEPVVAEKVRESPKRERVSFNRFTAAELDAVEFDIDYIVPNVLAARHVGGIIGAAKSLKTSIAADLAFSVATGGHFLGYWPVARPCRVAFMSGESGLPTLQENFPTNRPSRRQAT